MLSMRYFHCFFTFLIKRQLSHSSRSKSESDRKLLVKLCHKFLVPERTVIRPIMKIRSVFKARGV